MAVSPSMYNVFVANVPYDDSDQTKFRPALVMIPNHGKTRVYKITSKSDKSADVQATYYPIHNWQAAGLNRQLYVDAHTLYTVTTSALTARRLLGNLSDRNAAILLQFVRDHQDDIARIHNGARSKQLKERRSVEYLTRRGLER